MTEPTEVELFLAKTFESYFFRWNVIHAFREVAIAGLPLARGKHIADKKDFIQEIIDHPATRAEWKDKMSLDQMARNLAKEHEELSKIAIDAASLVFAHTLLDNVVLSFCAVSALAQPRDWLDQLKKSQLLLGEIEGATFEEILKKKLEHYIEKKLEREPLLRKLDLLMGKIKPRMTTFMKDYQYDRNRIERIDQDRHQVVHGHGPLHKLPNIEKDLQYIELTGQFLWAFLAERYDLRVHSGYNEWVKFDEVAEFMKNQKEKT